MIDAAALLVEIDRIAKAWANDGEPYPIRSARNNGITAARLAIMHAARVVDPEPQLDRATWERGEWDNEPDALAFECAGFACSLNRNHRGVWCGYLLIPPGHPWHGKDVRADGVRCEVAFPWWRQTAEHNGAMWAIGFDLGHIHDLAPGDRDQYEPSAWYSTMAEARQIVERSAGVARAVLSAEIVSEEV